MVEKEKTKEIWTSADKMMTYIQKQEKVRSEKCAKDLKIPIDHVEEWADVLEEKGLIDVEYSPIKGMVLKSKGKLPSKHAVEKIEEVKLVKKPKRPGLVQRLKVRFTKPEMEAKRLRKIETDILEKLESSYDLLDELEKRQKKEKKKKPKEALELKKEKVEIEKRMQKVRKEIKEIEKAPRKEIKKRRFFEFMRKAEQRAEKMRKETNEFTQKVEKMEKSIAKHMEEH